MDMRDFRYVKTMENIQSALEERKHNAVGVLLDCSSCKGFLVEINSNDRQYYLKIRVDADVEAVIFELHPSITVDEPYKRMFSQWAMQENGERKVCNIRIGSGNSAEIHLETGFTNAPLTVEAYKHLEQIIMQYVFQVEDDMDLVAHGIMPAKRKDEKIEELKKFMERLHHEVDNLGDTDVEPDTEDDDQDEDEDDDMENFVMNGLMEMLDNLSEMMGESADSTEEAAIDVDYEEMADAEEGSDDES